MQTRAFRMNLNAGQEQEYLRRHADIWPELVTLLREAGVADYRIFLDPESHALFALMTVQDTHTLDALPAHPVMQRWWQYMQDIMPSHADGSPKSTDLRAMFTL